MLASGTDASTTRSLRRLIVTLLACCGCHGTEVNISEAEVMDHMRRSGRSLLYQHAQPYDRLVIELDSVEDVTIPEDALSALRAFIEQNCDKPGGIEIVRDDIIPAAAAEGVSTEALALAHMDGPAVGRGGNDAAYLYILAYDSQGQNDKSNPHVGFPYGSAIYIDRHYVRTFAQDGAALERNERLFEKLLPRSLGHEMGHVLTVGTSGDDPAHCDQRECLMYPYFHGYNTELCPTCSAALSTAAQRQAVTHLSFEGPCLVRRQEHYSVFYLPDYTHVLPSSRADGVADQVLRDARRAVKRAPAVRKISLWWISWSERRRILDEIKHDPDPMVRALGETMWP